MIENKVGCIESVGEIELEVNGDQNIQTQMAKYNRLLETGDYLSMVMGYL